MNNLDCLILRTVLLNPELPKEVLLSASPSVRYAENRLKLLAEAKLLKIEKCRVKKSRKDGLTTAVEITARGIRYLKATDNETDWVHEVNIDEVERAKVLPSYFRSSAGQIRQIQKISEVNAFVSLCSNAITLPVPLLHKVEALALNEVEGKAAEITHISIVNNAMRATAQQEKDIATELSSLNLGRLTARNFRFTPKRVVASSAHPNSELADFCDDDIQDSVITRSGIEFKKLTSEQRRDNASKMVGVIDSFENLMTVYCTSGNTFTIQNEQVVKDKKLVLDWAQRSSILLKEKPRLNETLSGILLVKNHVQLASIMNDKNNLRNRKGTDIKNPVHATLTTLYIVPKTYTGKEYMSWLVTLDIDEYFREVTGLLMEVSGVTLNSDRTYTGKRYMPVKSEDTTLAIGTIINTAELERIKEKQKTEKISVLCYSWQFDYYEKVLNLSDDVMRGEAAPVELLDISPIIEMPY